MKWTRFRIKTTTAAEDIIISFLYDIGLEGAQIEDKQPLTPLEKEQMFVDIPPQEEADDGIAWLNFFLEQTQGGRLCLAGDDVTVGDVLERINEQLTEIRQFMNIGEGTVSVEETEDLDWINNWKQYFHQFTIDDILVIPSWEQSSPEDKGKLVLHIDPGTAFGTGMHETTQLCIRQLRRHTVPGSRILDVGTGSGILGILALMFGASKVTGTDLDPCTIEAVAQNCRANGISETQFELLIGNLITEEEICMKAGYECYDIVTANILADVLVKLTPKAVRHLKTGGIYITSGILDVKEQMVTDAVKEAGLDVVDVTYQGEWVCVTARKV